MEADMAAPVVEVQGTLQADGTLVLDEKPDLPPGRVCVRVQPLADLTRTPVWQVLEKIWAEQRASGHVSRSREEIDADIAAMRQEDEERMQEIERLHEECQRSHSGGSSSGAP
jgi:hypothetical protein